MKKIKLLVIIFAISLVLPACSREVPQYYDTLQSYDSSQSYDAPQLYIGSVRVVAGGTEHIALENWHHGFTPEVSASGIPRSPEEVADELSPFSFEGDFQIVIEGTFAGEPNYYFYKLTDGEWNIVLAVYNRGGTEQIFVTHGRPIGEWERVYAESFLDLLESGEYILDVDLWWSNSRAGSAYQNFFRFIK